MAVGFSLTQSTIVAVGFSFFFLLSWKKVVKKVSKELSHTINNCGCVIALTQSTIVDVGFSFFFLLSRSRGKR